jgi:hypothetical protein
MSTSAQSYQRCPFAPGRLTAFAQDAGGQPHGQIDRAMHADPGQDPVVACDGQNAFRRDYRSTITVLNDYRSCRLPLSVTCVSRLPAPS